MQPVFATLLIDSFFLARIAIPAAIVIYLGICQERRCGPAF